MENYPITVSDAIALINQTMEYAYPTLVIEGEVSSFKVNQNKFVFFAPMGVTIPVAVSAFPDELYQAPKSWVEKTFPKLIYYNRPDKGGHFAAWEQPEIFSEEMRAAFKSLR